MKRFLEEVDDSSKLFSNLYTDSNVLGKMFFSFAKPLLNQILRNERFDDNQLLAISGEYSVKNSETEQFIQIYTENREVKLRDPLNSLLFTVFKLYRKNVLLCLFTSMVAEMLAIYCCYISGYLIEFMQTIGAPTQYEISMLIVFTLIFLGQIFLRNLHYFFNTMLSLKMKKLFLSIMYNKLSHLSLDSMGEISDGKLIALLQSYIFILEKIMVLTFYCFVAPFGLIVSCAFIAIKGGLIYALVVQFLYIVLFWIQYLINLIIGKVISKESVQNDYRIGLIYQMLCGLRTIKCFAMENFFLERILNLRKTQVRYQRVQTALSSIGWALLNNSGYFISLAVLLIGWRANYYLNISFSFSTLTILAYLSSAILSLSLGGMTGIQQFIYVCRRISQILELTEQKSLRLLPESRFEKCYLKMTNCSFCWSFKTPKSEDEAAPKIAIQNVNFSLKSGEIMVVIGYVGSGKTTLLRSILNETKLIKGDMEIKGRIAYVEQEPFIFPGTVKENILFGKDYDKEKFDNVIRLCELETDFKQMGKQENTMMGDSGCNVSGGQKARISLARALYEDADIYLLDNPISALDSQISQKIVENVIKGYLKNKCVVLVTFQPKIVPNIDKLLVLDQGHQIRVGTPEEIYAEYGYLSDIVTNEASEINTDIQCAPEEADEYEICLTEKGDDDSVKVGKETIITQKEETRAVTGSVLYSAYMIFSKYSWGPIGLLLYLIFSAIPPLLLILSIYYLGFWASFPYYYYYDFYANRFMMSVGFAVLFTIIRNVYSYYLILSGSNNLHSIMCERVLRGTISFFDHNPVGKVVTRFAKDQFLVDQKLNFFVLVFSEAIFAALGSLLYAVIITPYAAIPVFFLTFVSLYIFRKCSGALAILQSYESNARDPLQQNILTMLGGIITCRAYDNTKYFKNSFDKQLTKSVNASFSYVSIIRWQGLRVQLVGGSFTLTVAWLAVLLKEQVNSSLLSVLMVFVMDIAAYILVAILFYSEFLYCMPSVERMLQLTEIKQEDALVLPSDKNLGQWPSQGQIKYNSVTMKYREELEPAVNEVSFEIEPGMKVGVVGRTGAGKSSILQTLFRLNDLHEGSIEIDGVNIKEVGLHTLRQSIGYIPQQAFLFSGTVSENLDPFDQKSDEEMISVLKKCQLWDYVQSLDQDLEHYIWDPNLTFSQGGKQLMCLARELLKDCKIIVMDEATASIDYYTDQLIQKTLREYCKSQTMITIAHRISTVIDADKILVMEKGKVAEYDHPFKLMTQKDTDTEITSEGNFAKMVKAYGEEEQRWLFNVAKNHYFKVSDVAFDTQTEGSQLT
ncbi:multidrug resistance-associated protein 4 [Stylonychia lemnae]|uniref:Multidrug resistance-associated protein 4 n=1 Tax=Stylonychia lemnae TaxID=5949 RepID=A0A077ZX92_STYLE|nr:multidrug resistance-associated protein 4 [Stylonychia lemnae]|eukprot:CDW74186.1 multidrug resistance-associated protein 4 [Stylonychia lemnae]